jgi:hypothetical protein
MALIEAIVLHSLTTRPDSHFNYFHFLLFYYCFLGGAAKLTIPVPPGTSPLAAESKLKEFTELQDTPVSVRQLRKSRIANCLVVDF